MSWITTASRLLLLVAASAALGWFYGYPREAVIVVLLAWIGTWLYQMQRLQLWLKNTGKPPPGAFGSWDELYAPIYSQQRKNSKENAQLQSTVEYLQDSFAAMRDGVIMVDQHGAIQWLNRAVEPLLGLRHPEDTGQTLTNLVRAPEFNQYFLSRDYRKPLQYHAIGDNRSSYLRVDVTHFGEGERLLFIRDISSQVRLENMRRDFVANVSHELRTPLTVISGYLSTILDNSQELPQRYVRPLQQMDQQAQRMESLLKDLLWLSRIESEKLEDERELVDVRALLQELKDELSEAYKDATIELNIEADDKVYGDYRQLYSAVSNLVFNAIKYSPAGSTVTINWVSQDNKLLLQVCDKGIGIDSSHIPRLTERFYRVDDSRNSETGGTGLGLAIVKHVAVAHAATLEIQSKLGEGSTFTLVFPNSASTQS
ncbi:Phosphate regulon sensor protein PhoR [Halioglobus japonicus]|nr:Phosphate regulon sensor protein PhoR [Halioglobus japonicus]